MQSCKKEKKTIFQSCEIIVTKKFHNPKHTLNRKTKRSI